MYVLFSIAIIILLAAALIFRFRRKRIICRILGLSVPEKVYRLNCLLAPFGFEYQISQDIFVTRLDAWQREYGYRSLYDRASPLLGMVFDCEPVYFDYQGKTWLLEFWKGQYGINTGAEIGIYRADTLLSPAQRPYTLFHTVPDEELPVFELELVKGANRRYRLLRRHWWLAGFCMGEFTSPELLNLRLAVTFHSGDMLEAFYQGLLEAGWCTEDICVCGRRISLSFYTPHTPQPRRLFPLLSAFSQCRNRLFLWIYCKVTAPFCFSLDQLLYLAEYLPFAFRHMICIQKKKTGRRRKANDFSRKDR